MYILIFYIYLIYILIIKFRTGKSSYKRAYTSPVASDSNDELLSTPAAPNRKKAKYNTLVPTTPTTPSPVRPLG